MRFAVVGPRGWAGQRHIRAITSLGHKVSLVVDKPGQHTEAAEAIGARGYASIKEADFSDCGAACVALPPHEQPAIVEALLERGVPTLCEKPLAASADQSARLVAVSRAAGIPLLPGYLLRFNPRIAHFQRQLADFGTLRMLTFNSSIRKDEVAGWRRIKGQGGVGLINACYAFDLANWFAGRPLSVVAAEVANVHHKMEAEDFFYASLRDEEDDLVVRLSTAWTPAQPLSPDGILIEGGWQLRIEAETDRGTLVLARDGVRRNGELIAAGPDGNADPFEVEIQHFVDVLGHKTSPRVSVEEAHMVQVMLDQAYTLAEPAATEFPNATSPQTASTDALL